jgi:hypothetical protein
LRALVTDDDRVQGEPVIEGSPSPVRGSAEKPQEGERVNVSTPGHTVFSVCGEGHVSVEQRSTSTDLRSLLTQQLRPQTQLPLTLERSGLGVDSSDEHEIAIEAAILRITQVQWVVRVLLALTFGGEQLDEGRFALDRLRRVRHALLLLNQWAWDRHAFPVCPSSALDRLL